jgi:hypothetical protein
MRFQQQQQQQQHLAVMLEKSQRLQQQAVQQQQIQQQQQMAQSMSQHHPPSSITAPSPQLPSASSPNAQMMGRSPKPNRQAPTPTTSNISGTGVNNVQVLVDNFPRLLEMKRAGTLRPDQEKLVRLTFSPETLAESRASVRLPHEFERRPTAAGSDPSSSSKHARSEPPVQLRGSTPAEPLPSFTGESPAALDGSPATARSPSATATGAAARTGSSAGLCDAAIRPRVSTGYGAEPTYDQSTDPKLATQPSTAGTNTPAAARSS